MKKILLFIPLFAFLIGATADDGFAKSKGMSKRQCFEQCSRKKCEDQKVFNRCKRLCGKYEGVEYNGRKISKYCFVNAQKKGSKNKNGMSKKECFEFCSAKKCKTDPDTFYKCKNRCINFKGKKLNGRKISNRCFTPAPRIADDNEDDYDDDYYDEDDDDEDYDY